VALCVPNDLDRRDLVDVPALEEFIDLGDLRGSEANGEQGSLLDMIL